MLKNCCKIDPEVYNYKKEEKIFSGLRYSKFFCFVLFEKLNIYFSIKHFNRILYIPEYPWCNHDHSNENTIHRLSN